MRYFLTFCLISAIFMLTLFISHSPVWASNGSAGGVPGGSAGGRPGELNNPIEANSFEELIATIAKWLVRLLAPLAAIMFIYAGFLFITAGGNVEQIQKAKTAITWAVVGIIIVLISEGLALVIKDI